jgi:UDP-glucose 4-epimerase
MEEFNVKNFIFSSSATVYGAPQYLPLDEKHPCIGDAITNPYGKSKYICEHILKDTVVAHPVCIEIFLRSIFIRCNYSRIGTLFFYVILIPSVLMNQV